MIHNELINYNCVDSEMEDYYSLDHNLLVEIIQDEIIQVEIKKKMDGVPGVVKRQSHIDAAQRRRKESMNELQTKKMSIMYSSSDLVHHFILYKMDDGRIADIYMKLTADKNVAVFEYTICVEH